MILSKYVSICNRSHYIIVDSSRNCAFWRGYPNLMHSYGGLLHPTETNLTLFKSMFNAEHLLRWLSWSILNGFGAIQSVNVYKMSIAVWNREKFTKNPYFGVQGRSRSSMLVPLESSSAVLVMIRSKSVSICKRSYDRRANSGKITIS